MIGIIIKKIRTSFYTNMCKKNSEALRKWITYKSLEQIYI